jgi:hypothetical protein
MQALAIYLLGNSTNEIPVQVNQSVELVSTVFRLAEANEYAQAPDSPYVKRVDAWFGKYKSHPMIAYANKIREDHGIGFDRVAGISIHLNPRTFRLRFDGDKLKKSIGKGWPEGEPKKFSQQLQQFAKDTQAQAFFKQESKFYAQAELRLAELLKRRPYKKWFDSIFGNRKGTPFSAIPGLLNGSSNYGMSLTLPNGKLEISPIIGVYQFDKEGLPSFDDSDAGTIAHEFCHTYTNTIVDQYWPTLENASSKIFEYRKELMAPQAYPAAKTMMYESLVRAMTVAFARDNETSDIAKAFEKEEHRRGFLWTGELATLISKFQRSRNQYPTFEKFMPEVVAFFEQVSNGMPQRMSKLPKVSRTEPADGSEVDSSTSELVVHFDRPMVIGRRGLINLPVGERKDGSKNVIWSEDGKSLRVPIKLEPGKTYDIGIGTIWNESYESQDGYPLDPVRIKFSVQ